MLQVININDEKEWDKIVKSFNDYDIYYLSRYVKGFQLHEDGEPVLFYYKNNNIRGINVVMKRDIGENRYFKRKINPNTIFDITTPYGYGGFIIDGNINETKIMELDKVYTDYCKNNGIVSEFVRFHPVIENSKNVNYLYDVVNLGRTITIELNSKEQIWNDLTSKNRNVIRKAKKNGIEIFWGRSPELIDKFIPLYNQTMDKDNADDYYYFNKDFYESVLKDIKYNSMIFYALYEKKIIAMSIILFANKQMHYHLSTSDIEYRSLAATNLLLFEAACWGCENGYNTFHLGGGLGSSEDDLFRFKKAFNKNSKTYFAIGKKIFDEEKYDELLTIRKQEPYFNENVSFFPAYRG